MDAITVNQFVVNINSKLQDSMRAILKRGIRTIPVVDENHKLVGIITRSNLVDIVYDSMYGEPEVETGVDK